MNSPIGLLRSKNREFPNYLHCTLYSAHSNHLFILMSILLIIYFILFLYKFIYLFLAALGLHCCMRAFSSCGERGLFFVVVCRLLIGVTSLGAEHRL